MIKTLLRNSDQFAQLLTLLEGAEECNLYQLDILENSAQTFVHEWSGVFDEGRLVAASLSSNRPFPGIPSGLCVPYGDPKACQILGEWERQKGGTRHLFGERTAIHAFYQGLGSPAYKVHCEERLFRADFIPEEDTYLPLSPVAVEEADSIIEMAAQMQEEDLGFNPLKQFRESFIHSVHNRVREERFLAGRMDGKIVFLIDSGTKCSRGVQVGNTFVPIEYRRQGFGRKGMRGCLQYFIPHYPVVTFVARESNIPAIKTHQRAGYTPTVPFQMIIMHE